MKWLQSQWPHIAAEIVGSSYTLLLLDYDGVLRRIVPSPGQSMLPTSTRSLLRELSRHPRMAIAVISERPITELRRLVGVRNVIYIGHHGREMWQDGRRAGVMLPQSSQEALTRIRSQLASLAAATPGVLVETRGLSVSLYYRRVPDRLERHLMRMFLRDILPMARSSGLTVLHRKEIIELRPNLNWAKGDAARWLLKYIHRGSILPIYIGDEQTDDGVFEALADGITIQVGAHAGSKARCYLRDVKEVMALLHWMAATCSTG